MTDAAVLGAISALSKKMDSLGGSQALDIPIEYTTIDRSEGEITHTYQSFVPAYYNSASVRVGNYIYYFGGDDGSTVKDAASKVDITTGKMSRISPYPNTGGVAYAKAIEIPGNRIVVVGGQTSITLGTSTNTNVYVYNIDSDTWDSGYSSLTYSSDP